MAAAAARMREVNHLYSNKWPLSRRECPANQKHESPFPHTSTAQSTMQIIGQGSHRGRFVSLEFRIAKNGSYGESMQYINGSI